MKAYGMRANRWSDSDRYWWRFTYANECHSKGFALVFTADVDEDSDAGTNSLRLSIGKRTLILALPQIIKPSRRWVDTSGFGDNPKGGYWDVDERAIGFSFSDAGTVGGATFLMVFRGAVTGDSTTDRTWSCFLPWTDWRHVRHSYYGLAGEHVADAPEMGIGKAWDAYRRIEEAVPTRKFLFLDYDGCEIIATTKIEEREWRLGAGKFKWLSWFRRPIVHRSLSIDLADEMGPEKGSWKGGLIGTSIRMLPGELHEAAFRRFCDLEHEHKGRKFRVSFMRAL